MHVQLHASLMSNFTLQAKGPPRGPVPKVMLVVGPRDVTPGSRRRVRVSRGKFDMHFPVAESHVGAAPVHGGIAVGFEPTDKCQWSAPQLSLTCEYALAIQ